MDNKALLSFINSVCLIWMGGVISGVGLGMWLQQILLELKKREDENAE